MCTAFPQTQCHLVLYTFLQVHVIPYQYLQQGGGAKESRDGDRAVETRWIAGSELSVSNLFYITWEVSFYSNK